MFLRLIAFVGALQAASAQIPTIKVVSTPPTLSPTTPPVKGGTGPTCAAGCPTSWKGDGWCDHDCNNAACNNDCSQHRCDCNASGRAPSYAPTDMPTSGPTEALVITPGLFGAMNKLTKRPDTFPAYSKNPSYYQLECTGDSFNMAVVKGMAWCNPKPECAHFAVYKLAADNRVVHFFKSDDNLGSDIHWNFYSKTANITNTGLIGKLGNLGQGRVRSLFQTKPPNWTPQPTMPDVCTVFTKKFECQLFNCQWTPLRRTCTSPPDTAAPTSVNQGFICAQQTRKYMCNKVPGCSWIGLKQGAQRQCVAGTPTQAPTGKVDAKCWEVNNNHSTDLALRKVHCDKRSACVWNVLQLKCFADKTPGMDECKDLATEAECKARADCDVVSNPRNNAYRRCKNLATQG